MQNANRFTRLVAATAIAVGLGAGTYGIASAANGSSKGGATGAAGSAAPVASNSKQPWGPQRPDETPLTGDALSKVRQLALAKVPGGTIVRIETDADGNASYEAHMTKADGTLVTVYVDKSFAVVGVESR